MADPLDFRLPLIGTIPPVNPTPPRGSGVLPGRLPERRPPNVPTRPGEEFRFQGLQPEQRRVEIQNQIRKFQAEKRESLRQAVQQDEIKRDIQREEIKSEISKRWFNLGTLLASRYEKSRQIYSLNDIMIRPELLGYKEEELKKFRDQLMNHHAELNTIRSDINDMYASIGTARGQIFLLGSPTFVA